MSNDFIKHQEAFADLCRGKSVASSFGWTHNQQFKHYQTLVENNVLEALKSTYPLALEYLGTTEFTTVAKRFFKNYKCQSHELWRMPQEFITYLQTFESEYLQQYNLLADLLQFEWLKVEVFHLPNEPKQAANTAINFLENKLLINPEMRVLGAEWPVHLLGPPEIKNEHKGNYFIAVNRNPDTFQVHVTDLSFVLAKFIVASHESPMSFKEFWLAETQSELPDEARQQINYFVQNALESKLILGAV